jgi:Spy/CpxP family protein refolding chaperone
MSFVTNCFLAANLLLWLAPSPSAATSNYAGQESRDIKALSPDEISSLLAGKGMGLAKSAELNGYPGPLHVLEHAAKLGLDARQRKDTEALFASMQAKAKSLGNDLVEAERRLDRMFQDNSITADSLNAALGAIGQLQAQLRSVHLAAHLAQRRILSPEQSALYMRLQGYAGGDAHPGGHKH